MRITIFFLLLLAASINTIYAQAKIKFSYDAAGNQIERVYCSDGSSCDTTGHKQVVDEAIISEEIASAFEESNPVIAEQIDIFPNPTKDKVTLRWNSQLSHKISTIVMTNSGGMGTQELYFNSAQNKTALDLSSVADGLYIVRFLLFDGTIIIKKIIKH